MSDISEMKEEEVLVPYVDIEKDETDETPDDNNYKLNNYGIDFDVDGLVRRLKNDSIYLPDFQRNYVWSLKKASKFIESLLLGLPIPGVFLYKEEVDQKMLIIDGFQRLETLKMFYSGVFGKKAFTLLDVIPEFEGKSYTSLAGEYKRKLDDTLIHATIVKADDPKEKNFNAIYMIFERLNTGGMNLSPQEIRNCVSHGALQKQLISLSKEPEVSGILKLDPKRKKDQEIILRLIALSYDYQSYNGNMKKYLNDFMFENKDLDNPKVIDIVNQFKKICNFLLSLQIDEIIRPNASLNIAILDSIWVGVYHMFNSNQKQEKTIVKSKIEKMLKEKTFMDAILTGRTHHTESVKKRIGFSIKELA